MEVGEYVMPYDRMYDRLEVAKCACGCGRVVRHSYKDMNDWNQCRYGCYGETIECVNCEAIYHVEHYIQHFIVPRWVGNGVSDTPYLVPNGLTLQHDVRKRRFGFTLLQEVISTYSKCEIESMIDDMRVNKYSTRVSLSISRDVVNRYYRWFKKRNLQDVIVFLQDCLHDYDVQEWTAEKMRDFKRAESQRIAENKRLISDVISKSFELVFV